MVASCCVKGCANRFEKDGVIKFCRFPTSQPRRRLWLAALRRKDWNPPSGTPVCGIHFTKGQPSMFFEDPDYIPHLKLGYETTANEEENMARYLRSVLRAHRKQLASPSDDLEFLHHSDDDDDNMDVEVNLLEEGADDYRENSDEVQECSGIIGELKDRVKELEYINKMFMDDNRRLTEENLLLKSQIQQLKFGQNFISKRNKDYRTKFYTGVPNYATFLWLLSLLTAYLPNSTVLSTGDILMLVLMKLKLNVKMQDLAFRFDVSKTTISNIINKSLPSIAEQLSFLVRWPERSEILKHLPAAFKHSLRFRKCRVILDCTEIFVERSRNLNLQALTWSQYKHHNTIKLLVGISPTGAITFVSKAFGGRVSDKVQTQQSGILDLLEPGDLVLADRGFLIEEDLAAVGASLAIPAFTKGRRQLSMKDVETTRQLARVRIHVERAMERIKNFNILSTVLPISLLKTDSIVGDIYYINIANKTILWYKIIIYTFYPIGLPVFAQITLKMTKYQFSEKRPLTSQTPVYLTKPCYIPTYYTYRLGNAVSAYEQ